MQCNESNDKDVSWDIVCIEVQTQSIHRFTKKEKRKKILLSQNINFELFHPKHLQHINILLVRGDKKMPHLS